MSDFWLYLTTATYVAAAIAVTVHVLLSKADVRAAIAWVGVAWLSPVGGALAYLFFGINRISRKARRIAGPSADAHAITSPFAIDLDSLDASASQADLTQLARIGQNLSGLPVLSGNRIEPMLNGDAAYPAMLESIAQAESSVALSSYIFRADRVGTPLIGELIKAYERGVAVRVLLDGVGAGYTRSRAFSALRRHGIPVARFLHSFVPWRMTYLNMRSHKKILVIDGRIGFTGGLNIGEENTLASPERERVQDTHFRIEGPVVEEMVACFAEDWRFTTGETLTGKAWYPPLEAMGDVYGRVISSGPDETIERLHWTIAGALGRSRQRVRVVTPYFLPDQNLMAALKLAALRGVLIDIVVPEQSNHRIMDWAAWAQHGQLLELGCRIHLTAPPFDHSKLMTVDGRWALFGSANWDTRSLRLNFEMNVECYGPQVAEALDSLIDQKIAVSRPLRLHEVGGRSLPIKIRDATARLFLPYL